MNNLKSIICLRLQKSSSTVQMELQKQFNLILRKQIDMGLALFSY